MKWVNHGMLVRKHLNASHSILISNGDFLYLNTLLLWLHFIFDLQNIHLIKRPMRIRVFSKYRKKKERENFIIK